MGLFYMHNCYKRFKMRMSGFLTGHLCFTRCFIILISDMKKSLHTVYTNYVVPFSYKHAVKPSGVYFLIGCIRSRVL
jgi:hypothetical protein